MQDGNCREGGGGQPLTPPPGSAIAFMDSLHIMYRNISKVADQSRLVNPRMDYVVLTLTSIGCLKLYLNP